MPKSSFSIGSIFGWLKQFLSRMSSPIYGFDIQDVKTVIAEYLKVYDASHDKETWFNTVKAMAETLGYCVNTKEYKQNPDSYKGSIADVTGFIRVALTNKQNTPDIYWVMQVLGENETKERLERAIR